MGFITINYKEGKARSYKQMGYKGVRISYDSDKKKVFNSGDFVKDWYDMNAFVIYEAPDEVFWSHSSSVDHFIMDNAPFESAYLHPVPDTNNEKWELLYWDDKKHSLYKDSYIFEQGIEFFVKKGTRPTWEELKKKYKQASVV